MQLHECAWRARSFCPGPPTWLLPALLGAAEVPILVLSPSAHGTRFPPHPHSPLTPPLRSSASEVRSAPRARSSHQPHPSACAMLRTFSTLRWCAAVLALVWLGALGAQAINVELPDEFVQCMPAVIGLSQSKGNVSIVIREDGVVKPLVKVSLGLNTTSWRWDAVDVAAGENFTIVVTDRSPRRKSKTQLSQSISRSTVDPSMTNDDSCLSAKEKDTLTKDEMAGADGGVDDEAGGLMAGRGGHGGVERHKINTVEVSVIASVLGALLLALLSLVLVMCWRRRRESRSNGAHDNSSKDTITARRIGAMGERLDRHRVVTLFSEDGRAEGQAILGREGDAGWSYMSRVVPGLQTAPDHSRQRQSSNRRTAVGTKRYDDPRDGELPSYGRSEYEKRALPKYADQAKTPSRGHAMVLTTRHDSQGSRLTFSADMLDPNGIAPSPRHSHRSQATSGGEQDGNEVIVFRPNSGRTLLPYERNDAEAESLYSEASQEGPAAMQAASTAVQSHASADYAGHRRSRSEVSLPRSYLSVTPLR